MKFKGSRGLMINGVMFEEDIFETNDKVLIDRFLNHPGLDIFFSVYQNVETVEEGTEEEIKKGIHYKTIKAEKMREREARGLVLNKKTEKQLNVMASGLGYAGEPMPKGETIIWIIKTEEELKIGQEEGEDES